MNRLLRAATPQFALSWQPKTLSPALATAREAQPGDVKGCRAGLSVRLVLCFSLFAPGATNFTMYIFFHFKSHDRNVGHVKSKGSFQFV